MRSLKEQKRRPYRLQRRAAQQAETHLALARAAFELHNSVGPSRTTVSAIAEKAGVQRLTVYRHFPDDDTIFAACTAHAFAEVPPPDPERWRAIPEPEERLRQALRQLHGYYRRRRSLLANLDRDAEMPAVAAALALRRQLLAKAATILAEGWTADVKRRRLTEAAIGHALEFATWRSLVEGQRLAHDEAIRLLLIFVAAACAPGPAQAECAEAAEE